MDAASQVRFFDPDGQLVAALSISGPAFRVDLQSLRSFQTALRESCLALSEALRT